MRYSLQNDMKPKTNGIVDLSVDLIIQSIESA